MRAKNRVGLFAYGEMGISALETLIKDFDLLWVIVRDNSSAKDLANSLKIKTIQVNSEEEIFNLVKNTHPDIVVISSYDKILSARILKLTKFMNVHHGDLPRWRGRANINWAIILGRKEIGLTFHEATPDLDAGDIYAQYMIPINQEDNVKTIYDKVNLLTKENMAEIVKKVLKGYGGLKQKGFPTYCCTRLPEDGYIDWTKSTQEIFNMIRALTRPYPGAFTYFEGKKMIVWDSEIAKNLRVYEGRIPGRIAVVHKKYGVEVLTGDGSIIIKNIHCEGKEINASEIITSVKKTLGISIVEIYETVMKLLQQQK